MKVIFVLDDEKQTVISCSPEDIKLNQIQPDLTGLLIPVGLDEQGVIQYGTVVTFPVIISLPEKQEEKISG